MPHSYRVVKESEDSKDSVIEKSGITAEFTIRDIEAEEASVAKKIVELKSMKQIRDAVMVNVGENHPFVLDMSEEDRHAVHMYHEAFAFSKIAQQEIDRYETALAESAAERAEITKQCGIAIPIAALEEPKGDVKPE